jgi:putative nucleotidyltransferase with HDIG domain
VKYFPVLSTPELLRLLDRLAAGASQPLFSVDDWARRLGDEPAARSFIDQMREEWYPVTVPDDFCQQMMDFAREYLAWHPGWPHLWAHILRVTGMALVLAGEAEVDPAHAFLLGIFHDIGKLEEMRSQDTHEEIGARLAREKLDGHYSHQIAILFDNVIAKKASPFNPYSVLIHDADKLDKIGATGIARRLSTDSGPQFAAPGLRRVEDDLNIFPEMHFPTSQRLAENKIEFTEWFLSQFVRPGTQDAF